MKTGGGKPDFIPHDEMLEKLTGLLGSTCTGFDMPFGGDGIAGGSVVLDVGSNAEVCMVDMDNIALEHATLYDATKAIPNNPSIPEDSVAETPCRGKPAKRKIDMCEANSPSAEGGSKYFFGMPMSRQLTTKKKVKQKVDSEVETSIITRNLAIASYYNKKKEKLDLEIRLLKLELAQKENNVTVNDI